MINKCTRCCAATRLLRGDTKNQHNNSHINPDRVPAAVPQQQVPDLQERAPVGERQAAVGGAQPEPGLFTEMFKELHSTTPNMAIGASCRDIGRADQLRKQIMNTQKTMNIQQNYMTHNNQKKQTILIKSQKSKICHHSRSTSLCKNTKRWKTTSIVFTLRISQKEVTSGRD